MLERFGGYTLQTLLEEDAELISMVRMVDRERQVRRERDSDFGPDAEFDQGGY
jgi:hypothetical protein